MSLIIFLYFSWQCFWAVLNLTLVLCYIYIAWEKWSRWIISRSPRHVKQHDQRTCFDMTRHAFIVCGWKTWKTRHLIRFNMRINHAKTNTAESDSKVWKKKRNLGSQLFSSLDMQILAVTIFISFFIFTTAAFEVAPWCIFSSHHTLFESCVKKGL